MKRSFQLLREELRIIKIYLNPIVGLERLRQKIVLIASTKINYFLIVITQLIDHLLKL